MTIKFCPHCEEYGETKVVPSGYKQLRDGNVAAKRRKIIHRIVDDGCGRTWFTNEFPEDVIRRMMPTLFDPTLKV